MPAESTDAALLIAGDEVCRRLSICKTKLHAMIRGGQFPIRPVRMGRAVRYPVAELNAWVSAGCPAADRWRAMQQMHARRIGGAA
jgi:predicted DNA-binding transcriptional regulator AlpA